MAAVPWNPHAPLRFVVNAASGRRDLDEKQAAIRAALGDSPGRDAEILGVDPDALPDAAVRAADAAAADGGAVVAVGGDGTIATVAQAAWTRGVAMGALAQGTFNLFARTHGLPTEPAEATRALLAARPQPVQVGLVNDRVFLVNASLGLYPEVLEDREAWKARFGRSRLVALGAAVATLLGGHRRLALRIELADAVRDVRTTTLFIGNNRLQMERVGVPEAPAPDHGHIAAVMLRPVGPWRMLGLLLRGAMGTLGDADTVDSFAFQRMTVRPRLPLRRRGVKLACDGEVHWMPPPLVFAVAPRPLWLLKPAPP